MKTIDKNKAMKEALAFVHSGADRNLELKNERLIKALHDAINRPQGVVPDSAMEFYTNEFER